LHQSLNTVIYFESSQLRNMLQKRLSATKKL
jgi:hypothetical protein